MSDVSFEVEGATRSGYIALPPSGKGRGVLVLHAWWGLTPFFKSVCDRLASHGFVAFAPDIHHGKTAETIDEAREILQTRDFPAAQATAEAALRYLQDHPSVESRKLGAVGFSMGAAFALLIDALSPEALAGIVLFYGGTGEDLSRSQARFQGHFGEQDDWEPLEEVKKMPAPNAEIFIYPDAGHWFVESNRPENYQEQAAETAWQRTVDFLDETVA